MNALKSEINAKAKKLAEQYIEKYKVQLMDEANKKIEERKEEIRQEFDRREAVLTDAAIKEAFNQLNEDILPGITRDIVAAFLLAVHDRYGWQETGMRNLLEAMRTKLKNDEEFYDFGESDSIFTYKHKLKELYGIDLDMEDLVFHYYAGIKQTEDDDGE